MLSADYRTLLTDIKDRIRTVQIKAALSVNRELIQLYWDIGGMILRRQRIEGWGKSVVERLAADVQKAFPGIEGFSPQNVWYMRAFHLAWADEVEISNRPLEILIEQFSNEPLENLAAQAHRSLEEGLLAHIRKFLIELGAGFAFVGQQAHLAVDGEDFYIDLLFYHLKLRSYIVIDLKATPFKPEYAGKLNFYLSAVDDLLRHPDDKLSIGLILCKTRSKVIAEYALRNVATPMGVVRYTTKLVESLPAEFKDSLPSPKEIEAELKPETSKRSNSPL